MAGRLTWERQNTERGSVLALRGELDETLDVDGLSAALDQGSVLDLSGITRINSTGVREWIRFVHAENGRGRKLTLRRCSIHVVAQLNMVAAFAGSSTVESIYAPYLCPSCDHVETRLIELAPGKDADAQIDAPFLCPKCKSAMELDDLREHYLRFTKPG